MTDELVIGVLHPGEMGAAVGRQLRARGYPVLWAPAGRSRQTADRAAAAGLADAGNVRELARRSQVVLSICPPHAALATARLVAAAGFTGVFADANAVSPGTAREIGKIITGAGAAFADGGIVGGPPSGGTGPRLYLSAGPPGPAAETAGHPAGQPARPAAPAARQPAAQPAEQEQPAEQVAALFAGTSVQARVVSGGAGAASAVKMAYAAWTKGAAALVLAARALARAEGVEDTLAAEWSVSQPHLAGRLDAAGRASAAKGWRWVAEMEEISAAFAAAGLPGGFHQAAAEVFRRSPRGAPDDDGPAADQVIGALLAGS